MKRVLILCAALTLVACASKEKEPVQHLPLMTPGSRLLYHNGTEALWTVCDRGARIYMTNGRAIYVVPGGCIDGQP